MLLKHLRSAATLAFLLSPLPLRAQTDPRPSPRSIVLEYYAGEDSDHEVHVASIGGDLAKRLVHTLTFRPGAALLLTEGQAPLEGAQATAQRFDASTVGLDGHLGLQWSPLATGPIRPFAEGALGMALFAQRWPPKGTVWNLSRRYGLGLAIRPARPWVIALSWRHIHYSNGKGLGPQNPAYDGHGWALTISRRGP